MCTLPKTIVPPPPPPLLLNEPPPQVTSPITAKNTIDDNVCTWTEHEELREACSKSNICLYKAPFKYKYRHFESILQVGPKCGLVALSMLLKNKVCVDEIFDIAKREGFSINGEMFSCNNMLKLAEMTVDLLKLEHVNLQLHNGDIYCEEVVQKLLDGAAILVPYDADYNHTPTLKKGHTAHWALICGVIVVEDPEGPYATDQLNIYVLAKHGKSKYLTAWRLYDLDISNKNLWEFAPKRGADGWTYALPEGGIDGVNGLRNQFLIFEGL